MQIILSPQRNLSITRRRVAISLSITCRHPDKFPQPSAMPPPVKNTLPRAKPCGHCVHLPAQPRRFGGAPSLHTAQAAATATLPPWSIMPQLQEHRPSAAPEQAFAYEAWHLSMPLSALALSITYLLSRWWRRPSLTPWTALTVPHEESNLQVQPLRGAGHRHTRQSRLQLSSSPGRGRRCLALYAQPAGSSGDREHPNPLTEFHSIAGAELLTVLERDRARFPEAVHATIQHLCAQGEKVPRATDPGVDRTRVVEDIIACQVLFESEEYRVPPLMLEDVKVRRVRREDFKVQMSRLFSTEACKLLTVDSGPKLPGALFRGPVRVATLDAINAYTDSFRHGYFLRRLDQRYTLERAMGLPLGPHGRAISLEEYRARLSPALFNSLHEWSCEGDRVLRRCCRALFGDAHALQVQMDGALRGSPLSMERMVELQMVDSMTLCREDMRWLVQHALLFGALVRNAEDVILRAEEVELLTWE